MKKIIYLAIFLLFSSCSTTSVVLPSKSRHLKKFNSAVSKKYCRKGSTEIYKELNSGLFGIGTSKKNVVNLIAESGADYYSEEDIIAKFRGAYLIITGYGYHCNFRQVNLESRAENVSMFASDHIPANCDYIGKITRNYYHDDFKNVVNFSKNETSLLGGNVANIEKNNEDINVSAYKCTKKQMAIARIESRKEKMDIERIVLERNKNNILRQSNNINSDMYFFLKMQLLNSY